MTQGGIVWLGTTMSLTARHFAVANVVFIILWLGVTFMLSKSGSVPVPSLAAEGD